MNCHCRPATVHLGQCICPLAHVALRRGASDVLIALLIPAQVCCRKDIFWSLAVVAVSAAVSTASSHGRSPPPRQGRSGRPMVVSRSVGSRTGTLPLGEERG
jgi:hypothetical protein